MPAAEASPRLQARLAGVFYLVTIAMGVFAEFFVRGRVVVRDDAAATAANVLAHETSYRLGLVADLVMLAAYIAVTLLLYELLRPVDRSLSLLGAFFSLVGIAVLAANSLTHLAPLLLLGDAGTPGGFATNQPQGLVLLSLRMHARGYVVSGVFFGIYCVLVGYLFFRSRLIPRLVGALMQIGGAAYLVNSFAIFLAPAVAARLPDVTVLGGIGELALALWLTVKGVRTGDAPEALAITEGSGS